LNAVDQLLTTGKLVDIVTESIKKADYFVEKLKETKMVQETAIFQRYFNVRFPEQYVTSQMKVKHSLMVKQGEVSLCFGAGITYELIN